MTKIEELEQKLNECQKALAEFEDGVMQETIDTVLVELDKQKQVKAEMRKVAWEEGYNQGYLAGAMESI